AALGGIAYIVTAGILFIPPLTMGAMFQVDAIRSETLVKQVPSPDGSRVAEIYFRPGGYSGSTYKSLFVRVEWPLFPLVERDIYKTAVHDPSDSFVSWIDNDTLRVEDSPEAIQLGFVRPETPQI